MENICCLKEFNAVILIITIGTHQYIKKTLQVDCYRLIADNLEPLHFLPFAFHFLLASVVPQKIHMKGRELILHRSRISSWE